ncbi:MAG: ATP-binding cassette domain-containing protein, partial [Lachnospiraceae bacterium]|nr:ATP-binding cassette domain-containing protein [Lachnospiraceae bacterium]
MIKVENVSLVIKKKTILDDINAEFADGRIHGLIGRNGSGKTVLMKCICG